MRERAWKALLDERWQEAAARSGKRLLKDPADAIARRNRALALYEAERWAEAARAFEDLLRREGPGSEAAAPVLFSLGYCRLRLDENRGSLEASTLFLELSDERHPLFRDGVQNLARALRRLGQSALAVQLSRGVPGARPSTRTPLKGRRWSRERILHAAFGVLRWKRDPLPAPRRRWRPDR